MTLNKYIDIVNLARLHLLSTVSDTETSEVLTEISLLLKSEVTTHNVARLSELVEILEEE